MSEASNFPVNTKATTIPSDLFTGYMIRRAGKLYVLLKASGTILDGALVKKDSTSSTEITVTNTAAAGDSAIGVNNTGSTVNIGDYFWALCQGRGYVAASATSFADGDRIVPAASGEGNVASTGGTQVGIAILDRSATAQNNAILFNMPSSYNG